MQKEPRLVRDPASALWRQATTRDDHVDMRMMSQSRPQVFNKTFWVSSDCRSRLRRRFENQAIDGLLFPVCDPRDLCWQGEDNVEVLNGHQVFGARAIQSHAAGPSHLGQWRYLRELLAMC